MKRSNERKFAWGKEINWTEQRNKKDKKNRNEEKNREKRENKLYGKIFLFYFHGKKGLPGAFQTLGAVIPKSLGFVLTPLKFGSLENIGKHA